MDPHPVFRQAAFAALALLLCTGASAAVVESTAAPGLAPRETRLLEFLAGGMPRERAMHATLAAFHAAAATGRSTPAGELRDAAREAPRDRVVQWLWANADARAAGCTAADPCPERAMALARLEPDNAMAWLPPLAEATARHDAAGIDASLARMAGASRQDDLFVDLAEAWFAVVAQLPMTAAERAQRRREAPGATDESEAIYAAIARAAGVAIPPLQVLATACNPARDPAAAGRRGACARVGRAMQQGGTSMLVRSIGRSVLARSGEGTPADDADARRSRWIAEECGRLKPSLDEDPEALRSYFADLVATRDEYEAMSRRIVRAHGRTQPPPGWASDWPASDFR